MIIHNDTMIIHNDTMIIHNDTMIIHYVTMIIHYDTTITHLWLFLSIKGYCTAGHYSVTGLETCIVCPKDSYQPANRSTSCIPCPSGHGTLQDGVDSLEDCKSELSSFSHQSKG